MTTFKWQDLPTGAFGVNAGMQGIDPMWLWAEATEYREHEREGGDSKRRWFAVERNDLSLALPDRFCGVSLTPSEFEEHRAEFVHVELAEPVVPDRMPPIESRSESGPSKRMKKSGSDVLIGIIDSGCPFASPMIRDGNGRDTRVLALWDQDDASPLLGGFQPKGVEYGRVIDRAQMNRWMAKARLDSASIDEELCYQIAGYRSMRRRFSHGAAVMSQLFAGPIGQPRSSNDTSAVDRADLVFVQIPQAGLQDSTSTALPRYVVDGIRFIVGHARKDVTRRIVVNISSGTSRSLHDGSSLVERALAEWVAYIRGKMNIDMHVVLPIGNTNREQRHAVLVDSTSHLELFIPPACEMSQFVTVRWPKEARGRRLRVTAPGGESVLVTEGDAKGLIGLSKAAKCGVVCPKFGGQAGRWLLAFAPTASVHSDRELAPAGRWRIELVGHDEDVLDEPVSFWISRNQRNPGALARSRQADFVDWDERHHRQRYLRHDYDDPADSPVLSGIRREGALSGMATQMAPGIVIVAGFVESDLERPSRDSAAGPTAGTLSGRRFGPDVMARDDMDWNLRGQSVRINRFADVSRVVGTSFAAPLVAREIANGVHLPPAGKTVQPRRAPSFGPTPTRRTRGE